MTSRAIWVDEIADVMISIKKDQQKLKHFEKIVFLKKKIIHDFSFLVTMCIYINTGYWLEHSFNNTHKI